MGDESTILLTNIRAALEASDQEVKDRPACFLAIGGDINGAIFDLKTGITTFGRSVENQVPLEFQGISRQHLKITVKETENNQSQVVVEDLNSRNGTFVNNQKIGGATPLKKGDVVKMGVVALKYIPKGDPERLTYDKLNLEAVTDGLTRCYNKSYFKQVCELWIKRAKVTGHPISLVLFDIDHFKKLNDNFGHTAGDYVLKELAMIIHKQGVREGDLFARYGGEEFVILLPHTNLKQSFEIAERLRSQVAGHLFNYENKSMEVKISVGVADFRPGVANWEDLFKRADTALYKSKNRGRNQVNFYKENEPVGGLPASDAGTTNNSTPNK